MAGFKYVTTVISDVEVDHDLTSVQRVALQAALGSDRKRELMATARAMRGDADISVLFKPS